MTDDHHHHEDDARAVAVFEAVAAVAEAEARMDGIAHMLDRHFRLGVVAVVVAVVLGGAMLFVVLGVRDTQTAFNKQARRTELQIVVNEVEVLRHRVHSKEGDLRLCTVALSARLGNEDAARICAPVVGPDFEETKAKLAAEERRLAKLRASR